MYVVHVCAVQMGAGGPAGLAAGGAAGNMAATQGHLQPQHQVGAGFLRCLLLAAACKSMKCSSCEACGQETMLIAPLFACAACCQVPWPAVCWARCRLVDAEAQGNTGCHRRTAGQLCQRKGELACRCSTLMPNDMFC